MLILAVVLAVALYGAAAPDPFTLGATRGAIEAIQSTIHPDRSTPRSSRSGTRSGTGSGTGSKGRSTPGTRSNRPTRSKTRSTPDRVTTDQPVPDRPRSPSRIGNAIRGWQRGSDRAITRRADAAGAIRELIHRFRARRKARQATETTDASNDREELQARAKQRARSSEAVQQIADQYPATTTTDGEPMPPTADEWEALGATRRAAAEREREDQRNGAPVNNTRPDVATIPITELQTLDQALTEVEAAYGVANHARQLLKELADWHLSFSERYAGAFDLYKNGQMNAAVALATEYPVYNLPIDLDKFASKLDLFLASVRNAKAKVQESDAQTGRVESARTT